MNYKIKILKIILTAVTLIKFLIIKQIIIINNFNRKYKTNYIFYIFSYYSLTKIIKYKIILIF